MTGDHGTGTPDRYFSEAESDWVGGEFHYDWQTTKSFHLMVGVDGTQSLCTRQHDYDTLSGEIVDVDPAVGMAGVFAEGELKVTPWLTLVAGLRVDYVQRISTQFSPRAAAIITPTKQDTIKAMYGRAFRAPNLYETFYSSPDANTPNPILKPEVVDTYELVWERQFKNGWRTTLDYYFWKMSDAMEDFALADESLQTRNGDDILAQGIEVEIQRQWNSGGSFRAYGSYGSATRDGELLTHSPRWIIGTSVVAPVFGKKTFLAIEPQIVGRMKNDLGEYTDPTFVTNVVLTSRDLFRNVDFQIGVFNLFGDVARLPRDNEFNQNQPFLRYPGWELMASLTYRF
jgi:iron complex outermembrane receptor protein